MVLPVLEYLREKVEKKGEKKKDAKKVEAKLRNVETPVTVAVMGCVVNGPGEAREADFGIAGGKKRGILFKKGKIIKQVKEEELLDALLDEIEAWK